MFTVASVTMSAGSWVTGICIECVENSTLAFRGTHNCQRISSLESVTTCQPGQLFKKKPSVMITSESMYTARFDKNGYYKKPGAKIF